MGSKFGFEPGDPDSKLCVSPSWDLDHKVKKRPTHTVSTLLGKPWIILEPWTAYTTILSFFCYIATHGDTYLDEFTEVMFVLRSTTT